MKIHFSDNYFFITIILSLIKNVCHLDCLRCHQSARMEFFGLTLFGSQNYIRDTLRSDYKEPESKEEAENLIKKIKKYLNAQGKVDYFLFYIETFQIIYKHY